MKNILVATDGSRTSNQALIEAKKLAECNGAKVKIIHVRDEPILSHVSSKKEVDSHYDLKKLEKEDSNLLLADSLKAFQDFSGEVSTVARVGNPAKEIIKEAKEENHDLIIIGRCGTGAFTKVNVIVGSVCNEILNLADINVLTII